MSGVLITGGTGLVGTRLSDILNKNGYEVKVLSTRQNVGENFPTYHWSIKNNTIEEGAFEGVDHIIHLAGAGIVDKKWTKQYKEILLKSRVETCNLLHKHVVKNKSNIKSFISASGIGYYGARTIGGEFTEKDSLGSDFTAYICKKWEEAALQFNNICKTIILRTGVVLSDRGGALPKMKKPIDYFVGAPLGSGKQIIPWIHIDDLCKMYLHALQNNNVLGVYNAVAPKPVTNKFMTKKIAEITKKPCCLPNVPAFIIKMMLGKRAQLVLEGTPVSCEKIQKTGFSFEFEELDEALRDLLNQ
ncbi:MAG: TIGR01777 family oxidoreductase [Flavobacteriales bacterium]